MVPNINKIWIYNYDFEFELANIPIKKRTGLFHPWFFLNRSSNVFRPLTTSNDHLIVYRNANDVIESDLKMKTGISPKLIRINAQKNETNSVFNDLVNADKKLNQSLSGEISPWGWSSKANKLSKSLKNSIHHSLQYLQSVNHLNSKKTSYLLRNEHLPQSFKIPSTLIDQESIRKKRLIRIIEQFANEHPSFHIKHFFGTSGQLSNRYTAPKISQRALKQCDYWIRSSGGILLEQTIDIEREFSVQFEILEEETRFIGTCEGWYSQSGSYIGSLLDRLTSVRDSKLLNQISPVLDYIVKMKYRGPLGIDFIEAPNGDLKLLEINARFTMGRISIEWHKLVNDNQFGLYINRFDSVQTVFETDLLKNKLENIAFTHHTELTLIHHLLLTHNHKKLQYVTLLLGSPSIKLLRTCYDAIDKQLGKQ